MRSGLAALLILSCAGFLVCIRIALWPMVSIQLPAPSVSQKAKVSSRPAFKPQPARIIEHNPFRLSRKASPVAYNPLRLGEQAETPSPTPALTLLGLIIGSDKTAIIRGFPGIEGPRVVREGDHIAGIVVKDIGINGVRLAGFDTTWVLRLVPQ